MNILILGGTGAMGVPLVRILAENNNILVTSRSSRQSSKNIEYIQGNAHDIHFVENLLSQRHYDAVVDFMVRSFENLRDFLPSVMSLTDQYVFISSARVYNESENHITEDTPRLLDSSTDADYLKTNEYALAKAREEDLIFNSGYDNFTIIRPSITYNSHRLQLGVFEKEDWLYRVLDGRSLVFSRDMLDKLTTMTHGDDVARGIASIIGRNDALGQTFHITYPKSLKWQEVLDIYRKVLQQKLGRKVNVVLSDKTTAFAIPGKKYQIKYCRYFNRTFDNSKISKFIDVNKFISPKEGLSACLGEFLANPKFLEISLELEAINDRTSHEFTRLNKFPKWSNKIKYTLLRHNMRGLVMMLGIPKKLINKFKQPKFDCKNG